MLKHDIYMVFVSVYVYMVYVKNCLSNLENNTEGYGTVLLEPNIFYMIYAI